MVKELLEEGADPNQADEVRACVYGVCVYVFVAGSFL